MKVRFWNLILVFVIFLVGCSSDSEVTIVNETYSAASGASVCLVNNGHTNATIGANGMQLSVGTLVGKQNVVLRFYTNSEDYLFSYDTQNELPTSNAVYVANAIGEPIGLFTYTVDGNTILDQAKKVDSSTEYIKYSGVKGQLRDETTYMYAYWLSQFENDACDNQGINLLFAFKDSQSADEFLQGLSFDSSLGMYLTWQKEKSFEDFSYAFALSPSNNMVFQTYTRFKDNKPVYDCYIRVPKGALATITYGREYIDATKYKNAKEFAIRSDYKVNFEGMYWKYKKRQWCYAITSIRVGDIEYLEDGMYLLAGVEKKSLEEVLNQLDIVEKKNA